MNDTYGVEIDQGGGGSGGKAIHQEDDDNLVLWVGNLDNRTTENMVYELFCQAGPIQHIRLPKNPDGQGHKGYSFVTFQHEASVPYAINVMEGTTLFGKKLKLQPRPGSVHRKLMDQKKASEQRQDNNFLVPQGQPQMPPPQQVPQQPQWFAHPQMAQVTPNMFLYQNQLYQSFTPNPNLNMNVMAIPFQPAAAAAAAQMASPFVQIPVQQQTPSMPPPQQAARNPRMQNGYNNYGMQGMSQQQHQQQPQLRTASPHQPQGVSSSHYNNAPQMNGGGGGQYHQVRGGGHYQNQRGNRPQRNGGPGYINGSVANNNTRMPYHQQQQQQRLSTPQAQQQYMMNAFQGQAVPLVQSPDFRRGNPQQQQQQQPANFPLGGQNYGNPPPSASNGFHNVVYHY